MPEGMMEEGMPKRELTERSLAKCGIDESKNSKGPNQCYNSDECDGERTCSPHGWCQGISGCPPIVTDFCKIDESRTDLGPNKCKYDTHCAGKRTCSYWGWCQGTSHCPFDSCAVDETKHRLGAHKCDTDLDCAGKRTCSYWKWCQGTDQCPKKEENDDVYNPCKVDETKHRLGAHKCDKSQDCGGKRTCSHWKWCQGTDQCPADKNFNMCTVEEKAQCSNNLDCKGKRACWSGRCYGYAYC